MDDLANFTVKPLLRCFGVDAIRPGTVCGAPAAWTEPAKPGQQQQYFCDKHKRVSSVEIDANPVFRRVTITLDVMLAAVHMTDAGAKTKAWAELERAVSAIGGVVNLHSASSTVGRYNPTAPRPAPPRLEGRVR